MRVRKVMESSTIQKRMVREKAQETNREMRRRALDKAGDKLGTYKNTHI